MKMTTFKRAVAGILLIILFTFILTGCAGGYTYIKAGVGESGHLLTKGNDDWNDGGGTGALLGIGYRHPIAGNWHGELSATHYSQWEVGPPFDNEPETETDHLFYSVEYHFGATQ